MSASERPLPSNRRVRPREAPSPAASGGAAVGAGARAPAQPAKGEAGAKGAAPRGRPLGPLVRRALWAGRLVVGAALFFGLMGGATFGLYRYVSTTPRFAVKNVTVEGASRLPPAEIARLAGVEQGKNIFALDLEVARLSLLRSRWVERATVERKLPGSVKITVVEREATAVVALNGALYLAARGGDVFKPVEAGDPSDLVLITGAGGEGQALHDREGLVALVRRAQELIGDYERTSAAKAYPLQEVHMTSEGGAQLVVGRDAVTLQLGKPPYRPKLDRGARVLAEVDRRKGQAQVVFLDNDAHPERVVARMR